MASFSNCGYAAIISSLPAGFGAAIDTIIGSGRADLNATQASLTGGAGTSADGRGGEHGLESGQVTPGTGRLAGPQLMGRVPMSIRT